MDHVNPDHIKKDLEGEIQSTKWLVEEIKHRQMKRDETGRKIRQRRKAYMEKVKRRSTQLGVKEVVSQ